MTQQHTAARFRALALAFWKGFPCKMVSSTPLACHRIRAVQIPHSQKNRVMKAAAPFDQTHCQLITKNITPWPRLWTK